MTGSLALAPAAKIVAGLQSDTLSKSMRDVLKKLPDPMNYSARQDAYAASGIDWRNHHAETFAASDKSAMLAEIKARMGMSHDESYSKDERDRARAAVLLAWFDAATVADMIGRDVAFVTGDIGADA